MLETAKQAGFDSVEEYKAAKAAEVRSHLAAAQEEEPPPPSGVPTLLEHDLSTSSRRPPPPCFESTTTMAADGSVSYSIRGGGPFSLTFSHLGDGRPPLKGPGGRLARFAKRLLARLRANKGNSFNFGRSGQLRVRRRGTQRLDGGLSGS